MRIAHIADLHIGKILYHFSLIEDQEYMLKQILKMLEVEKVEMLLIAGDVYDRAIPSVEAVRLLNQFLTDVHQLGIEICMIAGNHDHGERLAFGNELLSNMNVHIVGVYQGKPEIIRKVDEYGEINFVCIPYLRPSHVNRYIENEEEKKESYTAAMEYVIHQCKLDKEKRNILVSHQFVTGSKVDENGSEIFTLGGIDEIDGHIFDDFDYVALGHIHRPQKIMRETMRYSGTMLAYSFSEGKYDKTLTVIDCKEKDNISISTFPLVPLHRMICLEGYFDEIIKKSSEYQNDYISIVLNDEMDVPEAHERLRALYPNLMTLEYRNNRTRYLHEVESNCEIEDQSMLDIFRDFYEMRNAQAMNESQIDYLKEKIDALMEERK